MKTRVLVTGSNGQLGQTIKELSINKSFDIEFTFTTKKDLDVTNFENIKNHFKAFHYDYCINCAAYTNVDLAETEHIEAFKINAEAVKHLSKACKESNTILIHISTDYVFDGEKAEPYTEDDPTNPINEYGKSKLLGEQYIQEILDTYFIIRTSWLYSKYGKNFLKTILKRIQEDKDLSVTTSQTGTPTSCFDLAEYIFLIIKTKETNYGVYHFSAIGEATWYDFAIQIASFFDADKLKNIKAFSEYKSIAKRPKYSVLNNYKAQQITTQNPYWKHSMIKVIKTLTINN